MWTVIGVSRRARVFGCRRGSCLEKRGRSGWRCGRVGCASASRFCCRTEQDKGVRRCIGGRWRE
jgi:hypothetical protein